MSESGGRRLPPLSPKKDSQDESDEPTKRKKKKRAEGEDPPKRKVPARARKATESEDDGLVSPSEATPRSARRKRKARGGTEGSVSRTGSRDDLATTAESEHPPSDGQTGTTSGKKKSKPKNVGTSRETLMNPTEDDEEGVVGATKKKKKKKKKPVNQDYSNGDLVEGDLGLAAELSAIRDDVVDMDDSRDDVESTHWTTPAMRSEPLGTMFIEKKGGFKAADKAKLARRMEEEQRRVAQLPAEVPTKTTIQFALTTHRVFKTFTLFCHGLFAGFAFWHITVVFTMINSPGADTFLSYYHSLAQPVQSLYYLLFVLCTVSAFDRYDLSYVNKRFVGRALTLQNGAISCFFYFAGLTVSLSIAATDDKISLYLTDSGLWKDVAQKNSDLNTWRILNLVRGLMAILGWLVIALRPNTDRLAKNLQKADENMLGEQMDVIKLNNA